MPLSAPPTAPRFEHRTDASPVLGTGTPTPRLSWTIEHAEAGWEQTAYEVEVVRGGVAQAYRVSSPEQVLVPWPAPPLSSRERAEVRIRVAHGEDWSSWGDAAVVETGLLEPSDWAARFISPVGIGAEGGRAPVLCASIDVPGPVRSARLYATAHGVYIPSVNGRRVDDTALAPGWTSYHHRLRYHVYDLTDLVRPGPNLLEVLLGNGWYRGRLGYTNDRALYGDRLALLAQLEITTTDGTVHVLATDGTWRARESEVLADDLYDGQTTDLRLRGGLAPTAGVETVDGDLSGLVAPDGPPIRPTGVLPARRVWTAPSGTTLVDFGQNAVGWVRLTVRGSAEGTEVVLRHAEVLEDGELGTRPLRSARATDTWILSGPDEEVLEPSLTLHGFRYAEVTGVPGLRPEDVELVVVGSDLRRTGWFSSSHQELDRFHENVVWSTRGNFVDLPTDCPQRDERLGWTGDIQVFGPTATFLYDTSGLLRSWLTDLAAEQFPDGSVPHVVPDVNCNGLAATPAAAWGDAATIVPWTLYRRTGDLQVLERQLPSMRAWVDRIAALAGPERLWQGGFQYGDWLDPTAPPEEPGRAKAHPDVVATAHFARSSWILAESARLLGRNDEAEKYRVLAGEVRAAFVRAFVTAVGRIFSDAPTAYALAIEWDLLPHPHQREEAGRRLADLVRASGFRISTGFVGTPLVCDALTSTGHLDVAYRLLLQTQCPSWLYAVTMGGTTVWERWDSLLPDGSIHPGGMTSFNHYALGAVADWLHRSVAGLAPAAPGYRRLLVRPRPTPALTRAAARHTTPYGEAAVSWERTAGRLRLTVRVPVGATAEVHVPGEAKSTQVGHGDHEWTVGDPTSAARRQARDWSTATVRDLLDDAGTWAEVAAAADATGITSEGDAQAARMLANYLDAPASLVAEALAPDDRFPGAAELRRRVADILGGGATAAVGRSPVGAEAQ
ncbi:family 78 glycoside hydrolase catalytic domain [Streptomyces dysideae]|uniref:alpha-L-rhamnosidase n=1 Tax=Streptomyces dysideae TaxID=909626 RepID=A0A101UWG7_9ACTN|nr:family 78 glycoside hydrolase catalytic domain [Streptomyces dysideae]KUO18132.1 alpha-L-rhamnosidase [Streptomyces dysideae]